MKKCLFLNAVIFLFLVVFSKLNATDQLEIVNNTEEKVLYEIDCMEKISFSNVILHRLHYGTVKPKSTFVSRVYEEIINYYIVGKHTETGSGSATLVFNEYERCVIS